MSKIYDAVFNENYAELVFFVATCVFLHFNQFDLLFKSLSNAMP